MKYNRTKGTFIINYSLALGPGLLPDLQVGLIADHGLLSIQRRHLVLIKQKPQVLHRYGPKDRGGKKSKMGVITPAEKMQRRPQVLILNGMYVNFTMIK